MARRKPDKRRPRPAAETVAYADADGNVLELRSSLSRATIAKISEPPSGAAASLDDAWQRREEALFERLAVSWTISGLPIEEQKMLLGRYRLAGSEERRWIRETIAGHCERHIPGLAAGGH